MIDKSSPEHSPQDLQEIYHRRFRRNLDYRNRVWRILTADFFSRWVRPDHQVLDLGCGYCQFINHIVSAGKYGMDLNPSGADHAAGNVILLQQDCASRWPFADNFLDTVFSNFFEHLPVKKTLENSWGGHAMSGAERPVAGSRPEYQDLPGQYWDFFDHHLALTDNSLVEVLEKTGFAIEKSIPRFLPFMMVDGREYPDIFLQMYLRLPVVWTLLGKQFLVVGAKPER